MNNKPTLTPGTTVNTAFGPGSLEGRSTDQRIVNFVASKPELGTPNMLFYAVRFENHHKWIDARLLGAG